QRCPPAVPQGGVGGVDVGNGQQIEIIQVQLVADSGGKMLNDIRVGNIFSLRDRRHQQVLFDQPLQQAHFLRWQAVAIGKGHHIRGSQNRVITATAFADIVVKAGNKNQLGFGQVFINMRREGEFCSLFRAGAAAQVANNLRGMDVYRINMKEVVLGLADNAAKFRQIATENAVAGHALKLGGELAGTAEKAHEQRLVLGVGAKVVVN